MNVCPLASRDDYIFDIIHKNSRNDVVNTIIDIISDETLETIKEFSEITVENVSSYVTNHFKQKITETYHRKLFPIYQEAFGPYSDEDLRQISQLPCLDNAHIRMISDICNLRINTIVTELLTFGREMSSDVAREIQIYRTVER